MERSITANGISKSFGEKKVLDGITLTIGKGEIFGLLGPSGAGKTTLIRILTGQLAPDTGSCEMGEDGDGSFGIMMDDFGVYERLSCYDNLRIFAKLHGVKNTAIREALAKVGLADAEKTAAVHLSKGMQNRLRLARAFLSEPSILFLDEPTSGLDPAAADAIRRMIVAEKEKGRTIFLTTHNMSEAQALCDHVALLHDGRIIEYGAPQEICLRYHHQKQLLVHLTDGTDRTLPHHKDAAELLCELLRNGLAETIHTTEPDLETVFMELTGKELST